jgi:hypothetical protein
MGEENRVPGTISRRVAGIWFIWSRWSVSLVWFDERERQDRPALQINRPETLFAACPDNSTFTIQHSVPTPSPLTQRWTKPPRKSSVSQFLYLIQAFIKWPMAHHIHG